MSGRLACLLQQMFLSPVLRRIGFHLQRLTAGIERGFSPRPMLGLFAVVAIASVVVTAVEGRRDSVGSVAESFGATFYWGVTTVMGAGDASYVTSVACLSRELAARALRRGHRRDDHRPRSWASSSTSC